MKWYYLALVAIWTAFAADDLVDRNWGDLVFDLVLIALVVAFAYWVWRRPKPEGDEEVLRYLRRPPVDLKTVPERIRPAVKTVDNLALPAPGDEYSRLVEDHIKGCRTCQVHEEGKSE